MILIEGVTLVSLVVLSRAAFLAVRDGENPLEILQFGVLVLGSLKLLAVQSHLALLGREPGF